MAASSNRATYKVLPLHSAHISTVNALALFSYPHYALHYKCSII